MTFQIPQNIWIYHMLKEHLKYFRVVLKNKLELHVNQSKNCSSDFKPKENCNSTKMWARPSER